MKSCLKARGTSLSIHRGNKCAELTKWLEITPLELKLTIESKLFEEHKKDFDQENECSICKCELYDDLGKMAIDDLFKFQRKIFNSKINKAAAQDPLAQEEEINVVMLPNCHGSHYFHKECLENQLNSTNSKTSIKCAICETIYGELQGQMPPGTMSWYQEDFNRIPLQGYTRRDSPYTIVIDYQVHGGVQSNGVHFHGAHRTAYLPANKEGIEVLELLVEAFRRRLTFIVGTSVTTGQQNVVVWAGIHHKTSPSGGSSHFGYPDTTYLTRVKEELAARGIKPDNVLRLQNPKKGSIKVQ